MQGLTLVPEQPTLFGAVNEESHLPPLSGPADSPESDVDISTIFNNHDVERQPCVETKQRRRTVEKPRSIVEDDVEAVEQPLPDPAKGISWGKAVFGAASLAVLAALTSFLTVTAQEFYGKTAGVVWGWVLALSFEIVILLLAFYRPRGRLGLRDFSEALRSVPFLAKWLGAKVAMIALVAYSYQVVTVDVSVAEAHEQVAAVPVTGELESQIAYREGLIASLPGYSKAGAIGSLRATQAEIATVNDRIEELRERQAKASAPLASAKAQYLHTTRIYRLIALVINVVLGHVLAAAWSSHGREGLLV